jgi:prevent-host-death family protein
MHPISKSYSVRDLQRNYREVVDDAKKSHEAIVLINNSRPEAVLLDIQTYNALVADGHPLDEAYASKLIREAQRSYQKGKAKVLKDWDDLDA